MDFRAHLLGQGRVDEALPLEPTRTLEVHRHDEHPEVPPTFAGSRVTRVEMALVDHLHRVGVESRAQSLLDVRRPVHGGSL